MTGYWETAKNVSWSAKKSISILIFVNETQKIYHRIFFSWCIFFSCIASYLSSCQYWDQWKPARWHVSAKVRYLKVAVAGELRNDVAWLRIPPGHLRFILISVPMRMLLRWFYAVMFSSQCSNEDAVKMILCNVFKPSPAGYPLMLRESIWSTFIPDFVKQKMIICQRKGWFEPVNVDLAQTGAASPCASLLRLGTSIFSISTTSNPSPRPTWKAWPESRPSQGPRLSRGEKWK